MCVLKVAHALHFRHISSTINSYNFLSFLLIRNPFCRPVCFGLMYFFLPLPLPFSAEASFCSQREIMQSLQGLESAARPARSLALLHIFLQRSNEMELLLSLFPSAAFWLSSSALRGVSSMPVHRNCMTEHERMQISPERKGLCTSTY